MPVICGECGQLKPPKDHKRGAIIMIPKWLSKSEALAIMDVPDTSTIAWQNNATPGKNTGMRVTYKCVNPDHDPANCPIKLPAWSDMDTLEHISWDFYLTQYKPAKFDMAKARASVGLS